MRVGLKDIADRLAYQMLRLLPPEPAHARQATYSTPPSDTDAGTADPGKGSSAAPVTAKAAPKPAPVTSKPAPVTSRTATSSTAAPVAKAAPTAKSHAALATPAAEPTEEGRARYEALVAKFADNPGAIAPAEIQELSSLAVIYQQEAATA